MRKFLTKIRVFIALALVILIFVLWQVPKWQVTSSKDDLSPKERIELENDVRATLAQILGGAFVLFGLYFTWRSLKLTQDAAANNLKISNENLRVSQEGQITERFTRAIEQLGNEKLEIRLGGIYVLERIAKDSERDHWSIMEILTAYVRENSRPPKKNMSKESLTTNQEDLDQFPKLKIDIQAILTVIGRCTRTYRKGENKRLNLFEADISGADLWEANLQEALNLTIEQLSKVKTLYKAKLDPWFMEQIQKNYPHLLEDPRFDK
jgi:hypothetical protein